MPSRKYGNGIFIRRPKPDPILKSRPKETGDITGRNLQAIAQISQMAQVQDCLFLLAMTPLKRELDIQAGPRDYEAKVHQRLVDLVQEQGLDYIDFLPIFNQQSQPLDLYYDHIHLSEMGNQVVVQELVDRLKYQLQL